MPLSVIRFDMRQPGRSPAEVQQAYATALEMAGWADAKGFDLCVLSEHHASEDGFLPSPLVFAGAVAGRTTRIPINIAALLVPLHDPIRLAEDLAVLDHASRGRVSTVCGLGYRPVEYELFGRDWTRRGKRFDECLAVMIEAWKGEPFEHDGRTVLVRPRPMSQPHPMLLVGGSGEAAAKRAARFGLGFFPSIADPALVDLYTSECERLGHAPGIVALPAGPGTLFCAEDPDKLWAEIGEHLLHDARTYYRWQTDDIRSHVKAAATTVDELRAEGVYQIRTPEGCLDLARELGPTGGFTHHPLCGGTPPDAAWASLELFVDKVLPQLSR